MGQRVGGHRIQWDWHIYLHLPKQNNHSCKYINTLVHGLGVGSGLGITPSGIS